MPRRKEPIDPSRLPFKTEARCNVCQCTSRQKVDKLIAAQWTYKAIAEELIRYDEDFKDKVLDTVRRNVERHSKNHLDLKGKHYRQIMEKRLKEQGILEEEFEGQMYSGQAYLDMLIAKGTEQLTTDQRVRNADVIEAVKMVEDRAKQEYQARLEMLIRQVNAISRAVQDLTPSTMLPQLIARAKYYVDHPDADKPVKELPVETVEETEDE